METMVVMKVCGGGRCCKMQFMGTQNVTVHPEPHRVRFLVVELTRWHILSVNVTDGTGVTSGDRDSCAPQQQQQQQLLYDHYTRLSVKNWRVLLEQNFILPACPAIKRKEKEAYLYSAFYILCISQSAQAWITQFYLLIHHACLSFVSVQQMAPPLTEVRDI